jgi:choline-sulfatase
MMTSPAGSTSHEAARRTPDLRIAELRAHVATCRGFTPEPDHDSRTLLRPLDRRIRIAIAWCIVTGLLLGCERTPEDQRPNVILVSIDTLRADATSPYGGPVPTPTFDRLAREGVAFEYAYAPAPETAPSHATLFTGQEVLRHGVSQNGVALRDESQTLAEIFRAAGYSTAAFVSSWVLDPRFSWARGFDVYDASFPEEGATMLKELAYPGAIWVDEDFAGLDRRCDATVRAIEQWLKTAPEPFFLFVHLFDPHAPYDPPRAHLDEIQTRHFDVSDRTSADRSKQVLESLVRRYHAEVSFVDEALGSLLRILEAQTDSNPLLVVTADHGEGMGSHGHIEHTLHLYEEQLRVPLLFHWPGRIAAGKRIETPVGILDIAPTLSDLLGLSKLTEADGRSLAHSVVDGAEPDLRPVFGNRRSFEPPFPTPRGRQTTVRMRNWRYIRRDGGPDEVYDLTRDPDQRSNLALDPDAPTNGLAKLVNDYHTRMPKTAPKPDLSEDELENLRAMGYIE